MTERFPEIYRYAQTELRSNRLYLAASIVSLICIGFLIAGWFSPNHDSLDLFLRWILGLGFFVLTTYGASCTGNSILGEKASKTWDFQRLTPQSSMQITVGKYFGSLLYPVALNLIFFFWSVVGWLLLPFGLERSSFSYLLFHYLAASLFATSVGFLISAYSPSRSDSTLGRVAGVAGAIIFFLNVTMLAPSEANIALISGEFFGVVLPHKAVFAIVQFILAICALAAAKWRIGEEFLERSRAWRIPVVMTVFLWLVYQLLFSLWMSGGNGRTLPTSIFSTTVIWGTGLTILIALFGSNRLVDWKAAKLRNGSGAIPGWLLAWPALVLNLIFIYFLSISTVTYAFAPADLTSWAFLAPLFCLRDVILIQWMRLGKFRNPEASIVVLMIAIYLAPGLIFTIGRLSEFAYVVLPYVKEFHSLPKHLTSILVQIGIASTLLIRRVRNQTVRPPARAATVV